MKRREFIAVIGGTAALPLAARAQERVRHIGVLSALSATNSEGMSRIAAFTQGLQQAGWTVGRNLRIDFRWAAGAAMTSVNKLLKWLRSRRRSYWPPAARRSDVLR